MIDLNLLGIPEQKHKRSPTATGAPSRLSKDGLMVWQEMFSDPLFSSVLLQESSVSDKWELAIKEFLQRSRSKEINPFHNILDRRDNTFLRTHLKSQRLRLVNTVDRADILPYLHIEPSEKPRFTITSKESGFTLLASIKFRFAPKVVILRKKQKPITQRSQLIYHLTDRYRSFAMKNRTRYETKVNGALVFGVDMFQPTDMRMYYELDTTLHPAVHPDPYTPVAMQEYKDFVLKELWEPSMQDLKFKSMNTRLVQW